MYAYIHVCGYTHAEPSWCWACSVGAHGPRTRGAASSPPRWRGQWRAPCPQYRRGPAGPAASAAPEGSGSAVDFSELVPERMCRRLRHLRTPPRKSSVFR